MYIMNNFNNKQNLGLLWDVLLDELNLSNSNKQITSNVRIIFESNISPFINQKHKTNNIMELNKLFLSQVLIAVDRLMPTLKEETKFKKINISDEEVHKIEDIQTIRQANFERELEQKRTEMDAYLTPQKPKSIDFSFSGEDGKIKSMDSLIADKLIERNNEIEQITYDHKWLESKETSIKDEKQPKKVTWNEDKISTTEGEPTIMNIFSKLKKTVSPTEVQSDILTKSYEEQKSTGLPEIKQEQIMSNKNNIVKQNDPIIPKNELIKQMNEMNSKIDNMHLMLVKLTNLIEEKYKTET